MTSFTELRRDGLEVERWNMLHPEAAPRVSYVEQCLGKGDGPVIAATDYMQGDRRRHPALRARRATRCWGPTASAARTIARRLRSFFEVDRHHVAVAALKALADDQLLPARTRQRGDQRKYDIDPEKPSPRVEPTRWMAERPKSAAFTTSTAEVSAWRAPKADDDARR